MEKIFKYSIETTDRQHIDLPIEREVLCIQMQSGIPRIWVKADYDTEMESVLFEVFGTGHEIKGGINRIYIGTYQCYGVYHLFERI